MNKIPSPKPSAQLLGMLSRFDLVLVIAHDNPDPDAIASGWALQWMVETKLRKPSRLIAGGGIVRAENREMVRLLDIPLTLVDRLTVPPNTAAVLVDCDAAAVNHLLRDSTVLPVAVIDHHASSGNGVPLAFRDVRVEAAASASIVASYLREQRMRPSANLATALLYALRTETRGGESRYTRLDRMVVAWLTPRADLQWLSEIEDAPLPREYFSDMVLALQATTLYANAAYCFLPQAQGAEIIGEVADLLIRCQGVDRVLCTAVIGDDLLLSVRTARTADNATFLVRRLLDGIGQGGGHAHRAGGKIALRDRTDSTDPLLDELRGRWLRACKVGEGQESRLIARGEIIRNL